MILFTPGLAEAPECIKDKSMQYFSQVSVITATANLQKHLRMPEQGFTSQVAYQQHQGI